MDFNKVDFDTKEIRFAQKGMGLSLNGIAQGYITDKVAELLKQQGVSQALIDMGEIYGFDNANQREWNVSIRNPDHHCYEKSSVCHIRRLWHGNGRGRQIYPSV